MPTHTGEGGSSLLSPLNQKLISSKNTLTEKAPLHTQKKISYQVSGYPIPSQVDT